MTYTQEYTTSEPNRAYVDGLSGAVLLEFGAEWCPHCQAVQPALRKLFETHPQVRHLKVEDGKGRPLLFSSQALAQPGFSKGWQSARATGPARPGHPGTGFSVFQQLLVEQFVTRIENAEGDLFYFRVIRAKFFHRPHR